MLETEAHSWQQRLLLSVISDHLTTFTIPMKICGSCSSIWDGTLSLTKGNLKLEEKRKKIWTVPFEEASYDDNRTIMLQK